MRGHLVIADISGYTRFLTESELEHSNGILSELLNAIIAAVQAPLTVSNIEGDAVFMYGIIPGDMVGQTVLDGVEAVYYAFASSLEAMVLNTTCTCNACANINTLGLKIVMHCGEFAVSEIGGRETLTGPAVVTTHRLLKNSVAAATGIADYMFVTEDCVSDLGLERVVASWTPHRESYEDVGVISGFVTSLEDLWRFMREQNQDKVLQREAWLEFTNHVNAPPALVWDHIIDPSKRTRWMDADEVAVEGAEEGRIKPGVVLHCAHGEAVTRLAVLDMRPLEYITILLTPAPGIGVRYTDYLVPSGVGTRIIGYAMEPFDSETGQPLPDEVLPGLREMLQAGYQGGMEKLMRMVTEAAAAIPRPA